MKKNSIKLITLVTKRIMIQKKILRLTEMIKDIDEVIETNITSKSNLEDFEQLFKKLLIDFHDELHDDETMSDNEK
jgi:hypothetical protein